MFSNKNSLDVSSMLESRDPTEAEILTNGGRLDVLTQEKECNAWKNSNNKNGRLCSDVCRFLTLGGWNVLRLCQKKREFGDSSWKRVSCSGILQEQADGPLFLM